VLSEQLLSTSACTPERLTLQNRHEGEITNIAEGRNMSRFCNLTKLDASLQPGDNSRAGVRRRNILIQSDTQQNTGDPLIRIGDKIRVTGTKNRTLRLREKISFFN
jgi:hypothetical protein